MNYFELIGSLVLLAFFILGGLLLFAALHQFIKSKIKKFLVKQYKLNNMNIYENAHVELDYVQEALMESKAKELAWLISPPTAALFAASIVMLYIGIYE